MLSVRSAAKCAFSCPPGAHCCRFSACRRSMPRTLSLAIALYRSRNFGAAFRSPATTLSRHFGVNAPALHLQLRTEHLRESVRSQAPSLRSVSRPIRGVLIAQHPFPAPISGALVAPPGLHSPLGSFAPSGSKRSAGFHHVKLVSLDSDSRLLPVAISFDLAPDHRSRLAASRLTNRSVNPGTESMMHPTAPLRQMKNAVFPGLSTAFSGVTFQRLADMTTWRSCA